MTVIKYHYPLLSIEYPQRRDTFNVETEIHPEIQIILACTQLCKQHEFFILNGVSHLFINVMLHVEKDKNIECRRLQYAYPGMCTVVVKHSTICYRILIPAAIKKTNC